MTEQPNREVVVLNGALELPAAERAAYLDKACAGNAAMRQQVDALLQAHEQAEGFLETPPTGLDKTRLVHPPLTEKPGDRIGRYKLLQQIGEGGCGVVYMAEQEEPVRRRVALKVIKLGMDTKQVVARFEAERQALALMDHANIAKVLDAGATETGRPYFVMELVRGVKITEFCDEQKVLTEERLKLFIQICHAIQHAHQKGVIHRDIKPSNILVTVNDGVPVPKVIDFGIAKATAGRLTDQTLFTAFEQFLGTPAYMSPEQAVMTSLDIDTRSDIYSLGVLLYELLTGTTPFDAKELLAAGLDEMRRTIRETEPLRPSTRLSAMLAKELRTTAERRHTDAPKLIHLLRGDLDWIVMKCLEKDRARRYETANGLATDVSRHLNNEPVGARPPNAVYRLQKAVRRNKTAFGAAAGIAAALLIGMGVSTSEAIRASRAEREQIRLRQAAEAERKKSQQVAQLFKRMLNGVSPSVALGRDTTMLREIADKTAEGIAEGLSGQPLVEAELRNTLGELYFALRELPKAEAMHRRALALRREALGNEHQDVATSLDNLALSLFSQGNSQREEAVNLGRQALAMRRKLLGNEHPDVALSLNHLARDLPWNPTTLPEVEALHREELELRRKLHGDEHPLVAVALGDLSLALRCEGKLAEAEPLNREALAMLRRLLGDDHPDIADSLGNLSGLLQAQGRLAEAETARRENLAMRRKLLGDEHASVGSSLAYLAEILRDEGKLGEAEVVLGEALAIKSRTFGDKHPNTMTLRSNLADILRQEGKTNEANAVLLGQTNTLTETSVQSH